MEDAKGFDERMILSTNHKFLFIHVYKAAGMSIEGVLGEYDIRHAVAHLPPPQRADTLRAHGIESDIFTMQRHVSATDLKRALTPDLYNCLFKFAFVRNPWDLQLSLYHFNLAHPEFIKPESKHDFSSFENYIMTQPEAGNPRGQQLQFITDESGHQIIDFIGRFETLENDFKTVCAKIGLNKLKLEKRNATKHEPWPLCYSRDMFERVKKRQAVDIEAFGYNSDPHTYGIT